MLYLYVLPGAILLYMFCDVNYIVRTFFTVLSGRLFQSKYSLDDVTTIYGVCTFQDCDVFFKGTRIARIIREIDFARYHFYDRTGIYRRSRELGIKSLQGSTLTVSVDAVPLFVPYKIKTKLVYWDEKSLFFEHEVVTLHDEKSRCLVVSRQYAIGNNEQSAMVLLEGLPGSSNRQCPKYIQDWLLSMKINSGIRDSLCCVAEGRNLCHQSRETNTKRYYLIKPRRPSAY